MDTTPTADMETVIGVDIADNKKGLSCGASRRQSEPLNDIPIPFGGSAWYI